MNKKISTLILVGIVSLSTNIIVNADKASHNENQTKEEEFQPDPGPMNEMGKPEHDPDSDKYEPFQPDPGPMGDMGKPKYNKNKKTNTSKKRKISKNINKSTKKISKTTVNKKVSNNTIRKAKVKKDIKKSSKQEKKDKKNKKQEIKEVSKYNTTNNIKNPKTSDNNTIMLISAGTLIAAGAGLYYMKMKK